MIKNIRNLNYERVVNFLLMGLMGVVTTLSFLDLVYIVFLEIISPPILIIKVESLQHLLGLFLWVIIALELFATIRAYVRHHHFHVERIILVSVTAVARKVIVLDWHELEGGMIAGIAFVIISLCAGYFLMRRSPPRTTQEEEKFEGEDH
ncbi:MAG: phosphate-starvation-inducible PsiE family protein [Chloroflexota bacterium]